MFHAETGVVMSSAPRPENPVTLARLSGLAYLAIILCGIFAQIAVRGELIDWQAASATADRIREQTGLLRLGILADFTVLCLDVVLAVTFYRLLAPVDRGVALFALAIRLVMSGALAVALLAQIAPLLLLGDSPVAVQLDPIMAGQAALTLLALHNEGYILALMLFGLHCLCLGVLLFRAPFFPAILGLAMGVSGFSYLALGIVHFALPALDGVGGLLLLSAALPEFILAGWLLVVGLSRRKWEATG